MWWNELKVLAEQFQSLETSVDDRAKIATSAVLKGAVVVGKGTEICHGAYIEGPVEIGENCLIGNGCIVRGNTRIGNSVRIGFSTEIKNAIIEEGVAIGPQCYVADSKVERGVYLGAQVRTSNHRLDRKTVCVVWEGEVIDSGLDKLGCLIGENASLGIQVIILPGRIVAPHSMFAPRVTIVRNLPVGRYRVRQELESF